MTDLHNTLTEIARSPMDIGNQFDSIFTPPGANRGEATRRHEVKHLEDLEQTALMTWARSYRIPKGGNIRKGSKLSDYLFAIPNGGKRNPREAARLKAQGVKAGVSDLFLPIPRNGYHGLWIELKTEQGRLTDNQADWLDKMQVAGYQICVAYGWLKAKQKLTDYLDNGGRA